MDDQFDWIDSKEVMRAPAVNNEPKFDVEVSKIVGKPVRQNDPRLLALIVKWKRAKADPDMKDNFLNRPDFLVELKQVFQ